MLRNPAVLLTGDQDEAASWIPLATKLLKQLDGQAQKQRIVDVADGVTISVTSEGYNRKIHIHVEPPPVPAFIGIPYDSEHLEGWGEPYERTLQTSTGHLYGTEGSQEKREVIITRGERGGKLKAKRYPQYAEDYPEGIEWGNQSWVSATGRTRISWNGPATRGFQWVNNIATLRISSCWQGGGVPFEHVGNIYQGMHMTLGNYCSGSQTQHAYCSRAKDDINDSKQGGVNADFVTAFSNKVYKDGKVFYQYPFSSNIIVTGACVKSGWLHAVLGDYSDTNGVLSEWLYSVPLDDKYNESKHISHPLPYYGWWTAFGHPSHNTSVFAFNASGTKAVALRYMFNVDGTGTYSEGLKVIQVDVATGDWEFLWEQADSPTEGGGPELLAELVIDDPNTKGGVGSTGVAEVRKGEIIGAVDYKGDRLCYAYYGATQFDASREVYYDINYPDPCDVLHDDTTDVSETYIRFSEAPNFHKKLERVEKWSKSRQAKDLVPQYRVESSIYTPFQHRVISIDARYAMCVLHEANNAPAITVIDANNGAPYYVNTTLSRPLYNVDDSTTAVYVMGQEVWRSSKNNVEYYQGNAQFLVDWTAPNCDSAGVPGFSWYQDGDKVSPVVFSWEHFDQTAYMQVLETGEESFDFLVSTRHRRPEAAPVSIIGSWSSGAITGVKTLAELLEIGENYPHGASSQANFMPSGIL